MHFSIATHIHNRSIPNNIHLTNKEIAIHVHDKYVLQLTKLANYEQNKQMRINSN